MLLYEVAFQRSDIQDVSLTSNSSDDVGNKSRLSLGEKRSSRLYERVAAISFRNDGICSCLFRGPLNVVITVERKEN